MFNEFILDSCNDNLRKSLKLLCNKNQNIIKDFSDKLNSNNVNFIEWDQKFPLHHFAFNNEWENFIKYFERCSNKCQINDTDLLGNTPLNIAVKKGHKDIIDLLIFLNADVTIKNSEGWSPISESISYGNVKIVENLLKLYNIQSRCRILESKNQKTMVNKGRDFIIEFSWDVRTWIPILSKFLPSDKCKLTKCGSKLRLDQTLLDFNNQNWSRGSITCIINPEISNQVFRIYVLDNDKKNYQVLDIYEDKIPKEEIFTVMTSDIVDAKLDTCNVRFTRKTNFWSFGYNCIEKQVGDFVAHMYDMNNVSMNLKQRREHMSKKQLEYNKMLKRKARKGNFDIFKSTVNDLTDLDPPPVSDITWQEYKDAMMSNKLLVIGRTPVVKTSVKDINLSIGMSEDFPLEISEVLDVLEMILPEKKVNRIRELFSMKMPPGFPVTMDIPIVPTVTANISFLSAQVGHPDLGIDDNFFLIPESYSRVKKI